MLGKVWTERVVLRVAALASLTIALALAVPILAGAEALGTSSREGMSPGRQWTHAPPRRSASCALGTTILRTSPVRPSSASSKTTLPISHDWGPSSPAPGVVNSDGFSARWEGKILVGMYDGNYTIIAVADDGARVWVDDTPIVDEWRDQAPTSFRSVDLALPQGEHTVRMEYYENAGGAVAKLGIYRSYPDAYRAEYYNNEAFQDLPVLVREEGAIDHDWGTGRPDPKVNADHFSVIWTGLVDFQPGRLHIRRGLRRRHAGCGSARSRSWPICGRSRRRRPTASPAILTGERR